MAYTNIHQKVDRPDALDVPSRYTYYKNLDSKSFKLLAKVAKFLFGAKNIEVSPELAKRHSEALMKSDTLADNMVRDLYGEGGGGPKLFNMVMKKGLDNAGVPREDIPESLVTFYNTVTTDPEWLDREQMARGIVVSQRLGRIGMYGLSMLGLLAGYSNPDLAKPLVATGYLTGDSTFRRVNFTSAFWMEVTESPDALKYGGKGFNTAIHVRLKHGLARKQILSQPDWQLNDWGVPINTSDSAITNLGFSTMLVMSSKLLGFRITNDDFADVLHLWRYIGYLMGDDDELLPKTAEEAMQAMGFVTAANDNIPDADSLQLAKDLIDSFKHKGRGPWLEFTGRFKNMFYRAYAQYLIPPEQHKALKLPSSYGLFLLLPLVQVPITLVLDNIRHYFNFLTPLYQKVGRRGQRIFMKNRFKIANTKNESLSSNDQIIKKSG